MSSIMFFLFTVPDGKPTVTAAHNSSSTSIYLSWKPPPRSSLHGEFLGYRLAYRQRNDETAGSDSVQEIFLRDPSIEVGSFLFYFKIYRLNKPLLLSIESRAARFADFHSVLRFPSSL